jgi:uncharacterized protein YaaQ
MKTVINVHSEPDSSEIEFWGDIVDNTDKMRKNATQGLIDAVKTAIECGIEDDDIKYLTKVALAVWREDD